MTYFKPYIDKTGLHIPTYIGIRDQLVGDAKSIFGQDIYLGEDSQDYQWIATVAEKIYDAFQMAEQVYNNRAPNTAIGTGLDSVVKINGIKRKSATYSECKVKVMGLGGTEILEGIAVDKSGIKWNLPRSVIIPESGEVEIIAKCSIPGPVVSNPGDINSIFNPIYGWNSVYNEQNGSVGSYVEDDSLLRVRQSKSTAQASLTMLEGTVGSVAQLTGVTRSKVYENDTNVVDEKGLPPHSITAVVEGGSNNDIARAIWKHKGVGCFTNGDVTIEIVDSKKQKTPIRFFRPTYVDIEVVVNIKQLYGYTTETTESIKKKIQDYLNAMKIGSSLSISSLWGAALQAMPDLSSPLFSITSITASRLGETHQTDDISLAFNEVCRGNVNNVTANVV